MSTQNRSVIFTKVPAGAAPVAGEDLQIQDRPIDLNAAPADGELLVKNLFTSYDPYQRGRLRDASIKSYSPAYELNKPISNSAIAQVVKSGTPTFKEGDAVEVYMTCPVEEYSLLPAKLVSASVSKIDNPHNVAHQHFLHALGMPGLTAYAGLFEIAGPLKPGETIFISSAAGAVGQVLVQIAKRHGLKTIGSVGSDEKLEFITKECGFDGGFNYKKEKPIDALTRLAPEGIDIFWDNVGGEQLEAALDTIKAFGRIVFCGMISQYGAKPEDRYPIRNMMMFVGKRLKAAGFIVNDPDFRGKWTKEHRETVSKWIADGSFKPKIDVTEGIENGIEGFLGMLQGKNFGKAMLRL